MGKKQDVRSRAGEWYDKTYLNLFGKAAFKRMKASQADFEEEQSFKKKKKKAHKDWKKSKPRPVRTRWQSFKRYASPLAIVSLGYLVIRKK